MHPDNLLRALQAEPFHPFRIVMNDGTAYEVRHPEVILVEPSIWWYYFLPTPVEFIERYDILSYLSIARMEFAIPKPASNNGD
jgi:hypothetical protein